MQTVKGLHDGSVGKGAYTALDDLTLVPKIDPSVTSPLLHVSFPLFLLGCCCGVIPWLSAPEILK